jgi:hypothetical protein
VPSYSGIESALCLGPAIRAGVGRQVAIQLDALNGMALREEEVTLPRTRLSLMGDEAARKAISAGLLLSVRANRSWARCPSEDRGLYLAVVRVGGSTTRKSPFLSDHLRRGKESHQRLARV